MNLKEELSDKYGLNLKGKKIRTPEGMGIIVHTVKYTNRHTVLLYPVVKM